MKNYNTPTILMTEDKEMKNYNTPTILMTEDKEMKNYNKMKNKNKLLSRHFVYW
jgi:hypothetical protein